MSPRCILVPLLVAAIALPGGCRRVQEEAKKETAGKPSKAETAKKATPKPKAKPTPPKKSEPKRASAAMPPAASPKARASGEKLLKELEAERAAHARTKADLDLMTAKHSRAQDEIKRLRESLRSANAAKPPDSPGTAAPAGELMQQRLLSLGKDAYEKGQYDFARRVLAMLVGAGYKGGYGYYMLARSYSELGRTDEAIDYYKKACDFYEPVDPKPKYYVYALNNLGALLREQQRYQEARIVYERAQFVDPEYATAHYNLGVLYAEYLNDKRRAIEHYQRYVDLRGKRTSEVVRRIHKLREELREQDKQ